MEQTISHYDIARRPRARKLLGAFAGVLLLASCSSGKGEATNTNTVNPAINVHNVSQTCKAVPGESWGAIPSNANVEALASELGVALNAIAQGGRFGSATCPEDISVDSIGSGSAPLVAVTGEGTPCAVVGTKEAPTPGALAKDILAICADPSYARGA